MREKHSFPHIGGNLTAVRLRGYCFIAVISTFSYEPMLCVESTMGSGLFKLASIRIRTISWKQAYCDAQ
jgi:hypothetical protein